MLVLAAPQPAEDGFARWIALAGLALALISLAIQLYGVMTSRKKLVVTLRQASGTAPGPPFLNGVATYANRDLALVDVRNEGRPISVESIVFEGANGELVRMSSSPMRLPQSASVAGSGSAAFGYDAPDLPHTLAAGEVCVWGYELGDGTADQTPVSFLECRAALRAVVRGGGKEWRSNGATLHLRRYRLPDEND